MLLSREYIKKLLKKIKDFFLPQRGKLNSAPYVFIVAVGIILGLFLARSNYLNRLEWFLYDRYMSASTKNSCPAPGILVVAVDELSFQEVNLKWPWPRYLHAGLIESLKEAGAKVIVMDIIFDRKSSDPVEDATLVGAVKDAGNVVLAMDREVINDAKYSVKQVITPYAELEDAAADIGFATLPMDPDGVIRRTPLVFNNIPDLALAAARVSLENGKPGENKDLNNYKNKNYLIHYNGKPRLGIETVSYYQALNPAEYLPEGIFKDKIVLVGISLSSPPEVGKSTDHYETPVSPKMAGVEIHANILDSILRGRFIRDPFSEFGLLALLAVLITAAISVLFYRAGAFKGLLISAGAGILLFFTGYLFLSYFSVKIPVISIFSTVLSVFFFSYLYRFVLGIIERRLILGAFKHYLAPQIVDNLLENPSSLSLGGKVYEVSILFTDLANFTGVSEKMTPDELQRLLTEYFDEMMKILSNENATLDKFIGDAIMVFFGCPVEDSMHPIQACNGAIKMQRRLKELNKKWKGENLPNIRMRVGINSGEVIAGNMGTEKIFNYTILGDNVNLASRLEGVNKKYGTDVIISEFTLEKIAEESGGMDKIPFTVRELDSIRVKGKSEPVSIFELYDFKENAKDTVKEAFGLYGEGLKHYREGSWDSAVSFFEKVLRIRPKDGPSSTLIERCRIYKNEPPPSNWGGVFVMKTK